MSNDRRKLIATFVCATGILIAATSLQVASARADEIIIDNRETLRTELIAAPLVVIRPVTTTVGSILLTNTNITKDLIVRSATAFPEVAAELASLDISDPNNLSMNQLIDIINQSGYAREHLYTPGLELPRTNLPS